MQPGCPLRFHIPLTSNGKIQATQLCQLLFDRMCLFTDLCSHRRSFIFFAESVKLPKQGTFEAVWARDWFAFIRHRTDDSNVVTMGIDCPKHARGNYFLQTATTKPFSLGSSGTKYALVRI